jgi:hypothetical protein
MPAPETAAIACSTVSPLAIRRIVRLSTGRVVDRPQIRFSGIAASHPSVTLRIGLRTCRRQRPVPELDRRRQPNVRDFGFQPGADGWARSVVNVEHGREVPQSLTATAEARHQQAFNPLACRTQCVDHGTVRIWISQAGAHRLTIVLMTLPKCVGAPVTVHTGSLYVGSTKAMTTVAGVEICGEWRGDRDQVYRPSASGPVPTFCLEPADPSRVRAHPAPPVGSAYSTLPMQLSGSRDRLDFPNNCEGGTRTARLGTQTELPLDSA